MQIVTDSGMDLALEQKEGLSFHMVPLSIHLDGKSYGAELSPSEFYQLLANTESLPTTSQPPAGEFAALYRKLAAEDPDILSVHISSGLSGTIDSARAGAAMVPEANVAIVDTKTLSGAEGWQVEMAVRAAKAGWPKQKIVELLERTRAVTDTLYTLSDLKYLIHGGRISHIQGLVASVLDIKPVIGVAHANGKYVQRGRARAFKRAVKMISDLITKQYPVGSALRAQIMHAANPEGAEMLFEHIDKLFKCTWLPTGPIAPVLGAHTGPSLVGVAFAPQEAFADLPWIS